MSRCGTERGRAVVQRLTPRRARALAEVWLEAPRVDAAEATFGGERRDQIAIEQVTQHRICVDQEPLERVEEPRRFGDPPIVQQGHDVCAQRREQVGIGWRRAWRERPAVDVPFHGERWKDPGECGLEEGASQRAACCLTIHGRRRGAVAGIG